MTIDQTPPEPKETHPDNVWPYASSASGSGGTPKPNKSPLGGALLVTAVSVVAAVLILSMLIPPSRDRSGGATRSAELRTEQRQQEISQAIARQAAGAARAGESNGG